MADNQFTASLLRASAEGFAGLAASRLFDGESAAPPPGDGFEAWKANLRGQLLELAAAVEDGAPERFGARVAWERDAFAARALPLDALRAGLGRLRDVLQESLPDEAWSMLPAFLDRAERELERAGPPQGSPLSDDEPLGRLAHEYLDALRSGEERRALHLVLDRVESGDLAVPDALDGVLRSALREVGRQWHAGEISVAEEHFVSVITRKALIRVMACAPEVRPSGRTVVLAAVAGDTHDLGVQLVSAFFELDGWRTLCLGANVPAEDLPSIAARFDADLITIGATLDTQRSAVARSIAVLRAERPGQRVLVGGAAFSGGEDLWRRTGADGYAASPREAVRLGRELVGA